MKFRTWCLVSLMSAGVLPVCFVGCGSSIEAPQQPAEVVRPRGPDDRTPGLQSEGVLPKEPRRQ
jgi:hypothetical protein